MLLSLSVYVYVCERVCVCVCWRVCAPVPARHIICVCDTFVYYYY